MQNCCRLLMFLRDRVVDTSFDVVDTDLLKTIYGTHFFLQSNADVHHSDDPSHLHESERDASHASTHSSPRSSPNSTPHSSSSSHDLQHTHSSSSAAAQHVGAKSSSSRSRSRDSGASRSRNATATATLSRSVLNSPSKRTKKSLTPSGMCKHGEWRLLQQRFPPRNVEY